MSDIEITCSLQKTEKADVQQVKRDLRKKILGQRVAMTKQQVSEYSEIICQKIREHSIYQTSRDLCLYMPIRNEVDVTFLINPAREAGKKIWLPKIINDKMDFYFYDNNTGLTEGAYHIPEPLSECKLIPDKYTLIIMPGAVFSANHDRIGYGGGYYDRYLAAYSICRTLAVCYDFQIVPDFLGEAHDIKPEDVISNK